MSLNHCNCSDMGQGQYEDDQGQVHCDYCKQPVYDVVGLLLEVKEQLIGLEIRFRDFYRDWIETNYCRCFKDGYLAGGGFKIRASNAEGTFCHTCNKPIKQRPTALENWPVDDKGWPIKPTVYVETSEACPNCKNPMRRPICWLCKQPVAKEKP